MVQRSSPPGSPSYKKLHHVLSKNAEFYIDLGPEIFAKNEESIARMLRGYGLKRAFQPGDKVTLVETLFSSSPCPIVLTKCQGLGRIFIQSEQYFKDPVRICHESPSCVILEFSDHNYLKAQSMSNGWEDSFVLLPVMMQATSRLEPFRPQVVKGLKDRPLDMVFFGAMTDRRKALLDQRQSYLKMNLNRSVVVKWSNTFPFLAKSYSDAKVCLVAHAYDHEAGGEYHRLSEFIQFGCIPVMETFSDKIGFDSFNRCGGIVFTDLEHLLIGAGADVVMKIYEGFYDRSSHLNWWKANIQWERILRTVFNERD